MLLPQHGQGPPGLCSSVSALCPAHGSHTSSSLHSICHTFLSVQTSITHTAVPPPGDPVGTPHHPSPAGFHAAQAVVDAVQALVGIGAITALVAALRVAQT